MGGTTAIRGMVGVRVASTAVATVTATPGTLTDPGKIAEPFNMHRSNAQDLIARVPEIEVDADTAMCDGGGGATGHPLEYIELNKRGGISSAVCKYCGLRFKRKPHHH